MDASNAASEIMAMLKRPLVIGSSLYIRMTTVIMGTIGVRKKDRRARTASESFRLVPLVSGTRESTYAVRMNAGSHIGTHVTAAYHM